MAMCKSWHGGANVLCRNLMKQILQLQHSATLQPHDDEEEEEEDEEEEEEEEDDDEEEEEEDEEDEQEEKKALKRILLFFSKVRSSLCSPTCS